MDCFNHFPKDDKRTVFTSNVSDEAAKGVSSHRLRAVGKGLAIATPFLSCNHDAR